MGLSKGFVRAGLADGFPRGPVGSKDIFAGCVCVCVCDAFLRFSWIFGF